MREVLKGITWQEGWIHLFFALEKKNNCRVRRDVHRVFLLTNTSWHGQTGHGWDLSILLQQGRCVSDDFCCRPALSGARLNFLGRRSPHQAVAASHTSQRSDTKCNIINDVTPCHTVGPVKIF